MIRPRHLLALAIAAVFVLGATAATAAAATYYAQLNGSSQVPPNASSATGTAQLELLPDNTTAQFNVTFSGLVAPLTAAVPRIAPAGAIGPPVCSPSILPGAPLGTTAGGFTSSCTIDANEATALATGGLYLTLSSTAFPGGEIRGQFGRLTLGAAAAPGGKVSQTYSFGYSATSTLPGDAVSFAVTGGSLPPGLALAPNGQLSGTPTKAGTFSYTVSATGSTSGAPASRTDAVTIAPNCLVLRLNLLGLNICI